MRFPRAGKLVETVQVFPVQGEHGRFLSHPSLRARFQMRPGRVGVRVPLLHAEGPGDGRCIRRDLLEGGQREYVGTGAERLKAADHGCLDRPARSLAEIKAAGIKARPQTGGAN